MMLRGKRKRKQAVPHESDLRSGPSFVEFTLLLSIRLTSAQRAFALVAFDGIDPIDLSSDDRAIARVLFGDVDRIPAAARHVIEAVFGRDSGKSWIGALWIVWRALFGEVRGLAPNERPYVIFVCPELRLARHDLAFAIGALESSSHFSGVVESKTVEGFALRRPDGIRVNVEILPAARGGSSIRGKRILAIVLGEAAFFRDDRNVVNDRELYEAALPRADYVLVSSTPFGAIGLLHDLYAENFGAPKEAIVAQGPTVLLRDHDPAVVARVERARARSPMYAAREFDAKFVATSAGLATAAELEAITTRGVKSRAPVQSASVYVADPALRADNAAIMRLHREARARGDRIIDTIVIDHIEWLVPDPSKPLTLEQLIETIASLHRECPGTFFADAHLRDALEPAAAARGINYVVLPSTSAALTARVETLQARISDRALDLPEHEGLRREVLQAVVTHHPGGRITAKAPDGRKGLHDDLLSCLLLTGSPEVIAALPYAAGGIEVEHDPITFDRETHAFGGGRTHYYERIKGRRVEREPTFGTLDFIAHAHEMATRGEYTPATLRWFEEQRRARSANDDDGGISIPITRDE